MLKCRGEGTRKEIVEKYQLKPLAHIQLIQGQEKISCTGDLLTKQYYCFYYESKNNPAENGCFFCGIHAAENFLEILNSKELPLFNPLKHTQVNTPEPTTDSFEGPNLANRKQWDPMAKQLSNAINMLIVCWDIVPRAALANIKLKVEKFYYDEPFFTQIKGVNTIIQQDRQGRTLQQMIHDLQRQNGIKIKSFKFDLLNKVLEEKGIRSYFG